MRADIAPDQFRHPPDDDCVIAAIEHLMHLAALVGGGNLHTTRERRGGFLKRLLARGS